MINEISQKPGIGSYAGRGYGGSSSSDEAGSAGASEATKELGGKGLSDNDSKAAEGAGASQGVAAAGQVDSVAPPSRELQEIQQTDTQNQAARASQFQPPSFVG